MPYATLDHHHKSRQDLKKTGTKSIVLTNKTVIDVCPNVSATRAEPRKRNNGVLRNWSSGVGHMSVISDSLSVATTNNKAIHDVVGLDAMKYRRNIYSY